ncbi:hypothetical protein [Neochlamydia sp. S13]|uniref:hypothetical protein n=1 Tax=Neochlamydia sp. S13 TaxID=1353976 RepID=UPI001315967C|nr:hypothetical protein [Neochlamydia sp. S13]
MSKMIWLHFFILFSKIVRLPNNFSNASARQLSALVANLMIIELTKSVKTAYRDGVYDR